MIGKQFSHYQIDEEIGRGGMGVVYRATDTKLGRPVALKFLASHLAGDSQALERFVREAQAAAALRHDSICAIYDVGKTDDGTTFIVMPYYEGVTLDEKLADGPIAEDTAIYFAKQIAKGLGAAHEKGLIHRDIKPGNLLVTADNRIKILDFGLAKMAGSVDLTHTSSTVGTMAYMSPEQVTNGNDDPRSDLWAVGVVLYEMLVGEKPFTGQYDAAIVYGIVNESVNLDNDHISTSVRPILQKLLQKNVEDRYENAEELLTALRGAGTSHNTTALPLNTTDAKPRNRMAVWALGAVGILVLVFIGIRFSSDGSSAAMQTEVSEVHLPSVGVMYIENNTSRDRLGFVLRDMLARNLGQSSSIRVVSNQHLKDILALEGGGEIESISPATATRVARVAGVETMILGSVVQFDSSFVIDAELMDVETGQILDAVSSTARSESGIIQAVNELTTAILTGSGKFAGSENSLFRVEDVATASLTAYKLYEQGLEYIDKWDFAQAIKSFDEAIALDSTFVAPYLAASGVVNPFPWDPTVDARKSRDYLVRARQIGHASEYEIELVRLLYDVFDFWISDETIEGFKSLARRFPTEKDAHYWAGYSDEENRYDHFDRVLQLDPSDPLMYNTLAYLQLSDGLGDEAVSSARKYRSLLPDVWNTMDSLWEILTALGRHEEAIVVLDESLQAHPDWIRIYWSKLYSKVLQGDTTAVPGLLDSIVENFSPSEYFRQYRGSHAMLGFGRWEEARIQSAAYLREARRNRTDEQLMTDLRNHAAVLHLTGNHEQAEQLLDEMTEISLSVFSSDFNPIPVIAAYQNGLGYADAQNIPKLEQALSDIREALAKPEMDARHQKYEHVLTANLAMLNGDLTRARQELGKIPDMIMEWSHIFRLKGRLFGMAGDTDESLWQYNLSANNIATRGFGVPAYPSFFAEHARAPYEIARMFDDRNGPGDHEEAIRRYQNALDHWEKVGADFRYVKLAEDRLAELQN